MNDKKTNVKKKQPAVNKAASVKPVGSRIVGSRRPLIIFTAVFLGIVLVFAVVFGTIAIVRNSRAVLKYKNKTMSVGVARYLSASYKYDYLADYEPGVEKADTPEFWASAAPDGRTYGEILTEKTEKYLKAVLVANYLFDQYTEFTEYHETNVKRHVNEMITYRADGSEEEFNRLASPSGFDIDDYREAMEMVYKYELTKTVIFGYDGDSLQQGEYTAECEWMLSGYTHVMLYFIRTDVQYVVDPDTGLQTLVELDAAGRNSQLEKIEYVRTLIDGAVNDGDVQMTPAYFAQEALGELEFYGSGETAVHYYFREGVDFTEWYMMAEGDVDAGNGTRIVNTALSMQVGEYAEVETDFGVCFIYRDNVESGAYLNSSYEDFFSDFYSKLSAEIYIRELDKYIADVEKRNKFSDIDIIGTPYTEL